MWYIIRHGETSHNKLRIKQGHYPSVLNMKGIKQSRAIAKKLAELEENFDNFKFVVSPLLRTRQTIEIIMHILNIKSEAVHEDLIISRNKGIFENLPKKFVEENFPVEIAKRDADHWNYTPPSGESPSEVYERIVKFYNKYKDEENLVIVLHGGGSPLLRGIIESKSKIKLIKGASSHKQNCFYRWDGEKVIKIKIVL